MKPLSIVFISLLCIGILITAAIGVLANMPSDRVTFREEILAGSSDAAKGLSFRYGANYGSFLYWDCRYTFGGEQLVDTVFSASGSPDYLRDYVESYDGVILLDDTGSNFYQSDRYSFASPNLHGLQVAWAELYRETALGEYGEKLIRLKDYCAYYPLRLKLDTDAGSTSYASIYADTRSKQLITQEFNEYFRIPVLEDDHMLLNGYRYQGYMGEYAADSACLYLGAEEHNHFDFTSVSTFTDTVGYFTFVPHTDKGNLVDTSLIPGGYGIYAVSFMKNVAYGNVLSTRSLRTLCPLDPRLTVVQLRTSTDEMLLHVYAWDDAKLLLITFDIASGKELHRKELMQSEEQKHRPAQYFEGQDCDVLYVDQSYYVVLTENDDGTMRYHMSVSRDENQLPDINLMPYNICFDGQRLAIVYHCQQLNYREYDEENYDAPDRYVGNEIFVSVYDASGVIYSGQYSHTLENIAMPQEMRFGVQVSAGWK